MPGPRHDLVRCQDCGELKCPPFPFMAGYERQLRAAQQFFDFLVSSSRMSAIMVFGWAGTGKSVFPKMLTHNLNQSNTDCGLAYIRCHALTATLPVDQVRERLTTPEQFLDQGPESKLLVLDELDALAPSRKDNPGLLRLTSWAMDLLEANDAQLPGCLIIGITNNPDRVESAVYDRFPCSLYFEVPTAAILTDILEDRGIPYASDVTQALCQLVSAEGCRPTGRGVYEGANLVLAKEGDALQAKSPKQIAHLMLGATAMVSDHQIQEYERAHRALISKSDAFLTSWALLEEVKP